MVSKEDARLLRVGLGKENNRSTYTTTSTKKKKKKKKKIVTATTVDDARISTVMDDDVIVVMKKKNNLKKKKKKKTAMPEKKFNSGLDLESGGNTERTERTVNVFAPMVDTVPTTSSSPDKREKNTSLVRAIVKKKKKSTPQLPDHHKDNGLVDEKFDETRKQNQLGIQKKDDVVIGGSSIDAPSGIQKEGGLFHSGLDLELGGNNTANTTTVAVASMVCTVPDREENRVLHFEATGIAIPMADQEKQGAKCCNCCCDYRRAVIIMSSIFIILNSIDAVVSSLVSIVFVCFNIFTIFAAVKYSICMLSIAVFLILVGLGWDILVLFLVDGTADDTVSENTPGYNTNTPAPTEESYTHTLTEYSEYSEEIPESYTTIVAVNVLVFFANLYIYPVIGLISEIKNGIMSEETYPREEYSCCCLQKVEGQEDGGRA